MGFGEQFAQRLAAQHIIAGRAGKAEGRVGLPEAELSERARPAIALYMRFEPAFHGGGK